MKRIAIILMALAASTLLGAEAEARKVVEVKYVDVNQLGGLLQNFGVNIRADNRMKVVVLSGPADLVTEAEAAIKKLDVPPSPEKNIELLAYLVLASGDPQTAPEPADLAPAIKQMRTLFPYKSYRMLDTIWIRTRENDRNDTSGLAPVALKVDPTFDPTYHLSIVRPTIISTTPYTIRFEGLNLALNLRDHTTVTINSSFNIREGQKVVIGKTNPTGADSAIVLVVSAKVVE